MESGVKRAENFCSDPHYFWIQNLFWTQNFFEPQFFGTRNIC